MPIAPLRFICGKNLADPNLVEGEPWNFCVEDKDNPYKKMPKDKRRLAMLKPSTKWNVYTPFRGLAPNLRISKSNPPHSTAGLAADYDMVSSIETVLQFIDQMPVALQPTYIEVSLSGKIRLIWVFTKPILTPSMAFAQALVSTFFDKLGAPTLLAGFDPASSKPTEMWTNGGQWFTVDPDENGNPTRFLSHDFCFGVLCEVSRKTALFDRGEIPLTIIAEEVQKRFPGRWKDEFKLDGLGVRFWDSAADNPTGCQVKPDGMLCFTGNDPFVKWEQIFGRQWCEEQKVLNLGRAATDIYTDRRNYWEKIQNLWLPAARHDIELRLKGRGLSARTVRGATQSDVERVLDHIQQHNWVEGAVPLINYPPGIVDLEGKRVLNTASLSTLQPVKGPTGTPDDFPWIWRFLKGLFARAELMPLDHFLAWLQRSYRVFLRYDRNMGQYVFICGPKNNGKTLLVMRICAPLLGNRVSNPMTWLQGDTDFNAELFHSGLLAINDEDSPNSDAARKKMAAKIKGLVVNPHHKYHAKFERPFTLIWQGRAMATLNDDPGSVGMLTDVEQNISDKLMFFASQPYAGVFPQQTELEAIIARELPHFAWWLENAYQPPDEVLSNDRMGVKSYFDPHILELAHSQTFASNLSELIRVWIARDAYWENEQTWSGTATDLLTCFQECIGIAGVAREWTQYKIVKAMTSLAKQEGSGVTFEAGASRTYRISK